MATNQIKTRILNKYDLFANYTGATNFYPLKGEICIAEIPSQTSDSGLTPPAIGIKVGTWTGSETDGSKKTFAQLPWIQAIAGDVSTFIKGIENENDFAEKVLASLGYDKENNKFPDLNALGSGVADLQVSVGTLTSNVGTLTNDIKEINDKIGTADYTGNTITEAIKGLQDAVGADASGLGGSVKALNEQMTEVNSTIAGYDSTNTIAKAFEQTNTSVSNLSGRVDGISTALETLNGDENTVGSVAHTTATKIAEIVAGADTKYDTLKEIADWILNDTTGAADMANDIADLQGQLVGIEGTVADKITTEINSALKTEGVDKYALASELTRVSNALSDLESSAVQSATFAGATMKKEGTALSISKTDAQAALELGSAAYKADSDFATAAQGSAAESALQSVTILGHTLNKDSSELTVEQTKTDLGLGSAAYKAEDHFATAGDLTQLSTAISEMNISYNESAEGGVMTAITQTGAKITSVTQRKIKPADMSNDSNDVFVFYCGTASELIN